MVCYVVLEFSSTFYSCTRYISGFCFYKHCTQLRLKKKKKKFNVLSFPAANNTMNIDFSKQYHYLINNTTKEVSNSFTN